MISKILNIETMQEGSVTKVSSKGNILVHWNSGHIYWIKRKDIWKVKEDYYTKIYYVRNPKPMRTLRHV